MPDKFTELFDQLQNEFAQNYGRPLTVTGGPDTPMHRKLHNGVARDVRVRDLTPEQGNFIVQKAQELGLHPRDFRQTWKEHKGSGPHIHIDAKSELNSRPNPQASQNRLQSIVSKAPPGRASFSQNAAPQPAMPSILDSLLSQKEPPMYRQIINEVMGNTGVDEQTAREYLNHPEGRKKYPIDLNPQQQQQQAFENSVIADKVPFDISSPAQTGTPLAEGARLPKIKPETAKTSGRGFVRANQAIAAPKQAAVTDKSRVNAFTLKIGALDSEINQMATTRRKMLEAGTPPEMLAKFDSVINDKAKERATLQSEITTVKAGKSVPLARRIKDAEEARGAALKLATNIQDAAEQGRLQDEANQYNDRVQYLKALQGKEHAGEIIHPRVLDAVTRPLNKYKKPTSMLEIDKSVPLADQISASIASGYDSAISGIDTLGANIAHYVAPGQEEALRQRAKGFQETSGYSRDEQGQGLVPTLGNVVGQSVPTLPLMVATGGAGGTAAEALGIPAVAGESAALASYGALEHAHEGKLEALKAAALNAALPLGGASLSGMSLPTRIAGGFASGFIPTAGMEAIDKKSLADIDLNSAIAQGLVGAGFEAAGSRGKGEKANADHAQSVSENLRTESPIVEVAKPFEQGYKYEKRPGDEKLQEAIAEKYKQDDNGNSRAAREGFTPEERDYMDRVSGRNRRASTKQGAPEQPVTSKPQIAEDLQKASEEPPIARDAETPQPFENRYKPIEVDVAPKEEPKPERPAKRENDGPAIKPKEQSLEQALKFNENVEASMDRNFPEPPKTAGDSRNVIDNRKAENPPAPAEAAPAERSFMVNDKPVAVTDAETISRYDEAKQKHDTAIERASRMSDRQSVGKAKKAAGLQFAADKRKIANMMKLKEVAAEQKLEVRSQKSEPAKPETTGDAWIDPEFGEVKALTRQTAANFGKLYALDTKGEVRNVTKPQKSAENTTKNIPEPAQVEVKQDVKVPISDTRSDGNAVAKKTTVAEPDIVQAIRDKGGIASVDRPGEVKSLRESKLKQPGVFTKEGQSYDDMAQSLYDDGYLYEPGPEEMFTMLDRAAKGEKIGKRFSEDLQNSQEQKDAEAFANRPIEGEKQNADTLRTESRDNAGARQVKPITAEVVPESAKVTGARARLDDARTRLVELNRRREKGESVGLELIEQQRLVNRAANELKLETAAKPAVREDLEGARREIAETFKRGETPNAKAIIEKYRIGGDRAGEALQKVRDIMGDEAGKRIKDKFTSEPEPESRSPYTARTFEDLQTPKQGNAIFSITSQKGVDADFLAKERYGVKAEDLNKSTALKFIAELKSMTPEEFAKAREGAQAAFERDNPEIAAFNKKAESAAQEPKIVSDARARNQQRLAGNQLSSNPVDALIDSAITTGYDIYKGTKDFAEWSGKMIKKMGDEIKPHLEKVYARLRASRKPHEMTEKEFEESSFPRAGDIVDGRKVRDHIPNQESIESSLDNYKILPGVREVKMSEFDDGKPEYHSASQKQRTKQLAEEIADSKELNPLIVAYDKNGAYILEGGHRFDALKEIGAKSFPAKVVIEYDREGAGFHYDEVKNAIAEGKSVPPEVLAEHPDLKQSGKAPAGFKDSERGFLGFGGKPDLTTLARFQSDKGAKGFNRFKLEAAKAGYTNKTDINNAWNAAQNMPTLMSGSEIAKDLLNVPKTLEATGEVSMVLRQGGILSVQHPILAAKALARAVKAVSPKSFEAFKQEIDTHPRAKQMEDAGLYLSNREQGGGINAREEAFMSKLIGKIPILGQVHQGTERVNTTFLDSIRQDAFTQYAEAIDGAKGKESDFAAAADWINNVTGRGSIPKSLEKFEPVLNGTLFSPRFLTSRLRVLNPIAYARMYKESPIVAKKAMADMAKYMAVVGTTLTLAKAAGATVSLDPDEADFLKIKLGDTHYDILSGLQQPLRAALRVGMRGVNAARGEKVEDKNKVLAIAGTFGRSKLSPIAGCLVDADQGKNMVGEKFDFKSNTAKLFLPLYYKDLYDAYQKEGMAGINKTAAPGMLGVGVQTYNRKGKNGSAPALQF